MKDKKIQVGQTVAVMPSRFDIEKEPFEAVVSSVGKKYFTIEGRSEKYDLATGIQANDTNYKNIVYASMQELNEYIEYARLSAKIKSAFRAYGELEYTLEQLRKIAEIIGIQ